MRYRDLEGTASVPSSFAAELDRGMLDQVVCMLGSKDYRGLAGTVSQTGVPLSVARTT